MIVLTQLVYVHAGETVAFEAFEAAVLPRLGLYGGELLLRARPRKLEGSLDEPSEIHLVRFPDEAALAAYTADPIRLQHVHLKDAAVRMQLLYRAHNSG
ncbi:MAG: DUF1330 domain-containing protein [Kofleriaceae bacterium]